MNMQAVFADSLRLIGKSAVFMKLIFRLRYRSQFGQSLWLAGNHPSLGGGTIEKAIPLIYLNEEVWQATVEVPLDATGCPITYDYILRNADGSSVTDWGRDRALIPSEFGCNGLLVMDSWNNAGAAENVFYTEPFKNVLLAGNFTGVRPPARPIRRIRSGSRRPCLARARRFVCSATAWRWEIGTPRGRFY